MDANSCCFLEDFLAIWSVRNRKILSHGVESSVV